MHKLGLGVMVAALVLAAWGLRVAAQVPRAVPEQTERVNWTEMRGTATDIGAGADGTVYAIDPEGHVWRRRPGPASGWIILPGIFSRIDGTPDGKAWAIDAAGDIFRYTGAFWQRVPGKAKDVGVGADGSVWIVGADGSISRYSTRSHSFIPLETPPAVGLRVDVDETGLPWMVAADGGVWRFDGVAWERMPGPPAKDVSVGKEGGVIIIGEDQRVYRRDPPSASWIWISALASAVSAGPGGTIWIATPEGFIYTSSRIPAFARPAEKVELVIKPVLNWRKRRGAARDIAVGANGAAYAIGLEGEVFQWRGKGTWSQLPGRLEHIATDPSGTPWGVDAKGRILRYQGSYWEEFPGLAMDIAIGARGAVWILQTDGVPALWIAPDRIWRPLPGATGIDIAVDPDGHPWIVNQDSAVQRHDGEKWVPVPGVSAKGIAVGSDGTVLAAGRDHRPYWYDIKRSAWEQLNGDTDVISIGPRGFPWAVSSQSEIFSTAELDDERHTDSQRGVPFQQQPQARTPVLPWAFVAPGPTQQPTNEAPIRFAKVIGVARDVAIGLDGSVFAIGFDGGLSRYSNLQSRFLAFPGNLQRVAIAPDGRPWGLTPAGDVFRHDGVDWRQVPQSRGVDIAIGANGTVIISDSNEALFRYDVVTNRFQLMLSPSGQRSPFGLKIAVDRNGNPWTVTGGNQLYRCDRDPCELIPVLARDVAIGPEDTVVIIDIDRGLRRLNGGSGRFDPIPTQSLGTVSTVSVGPKGRPWITTGTNEIYASAIFPRDERNDQNVAQRTIQNTTPNNVPVFTFTQTPVFATVPAITTTQFQVIGANGTVAALNATGFNILVYNPISNAFAVDASLSNFSGSAIATPLISMAIAADGAMWVVDVSNNVFRRSGNKYVQVPGLSTVCALPTCGSPSPVSVGVGGNGAVFVNNVADLLYQYNPQTNRFELFIVQPPQSGALLVRGDPNGNPWLIDPLGDVYTFTGIAFIRRPIKSNPFSCQGCLSIGANGSVYVIDSASGKLKRWNQSNQAFDNINTPSGTLVSAAVAPDGRLWVQVGGTIYRAR